MRQLFRIGRAALGVLGALASASCIYEGPLGVQAQGVWCASIPGVEGVDVSYYQGTVDWNAVHASGRQFAIARISDGTGFNDPTFARNWAGIRAAGMIRGAYQFFRPNQSATAQADLVCSALGRLGPGDLPAMLDLEADGGQSNAAIISGITTWLQRVETCTGKRPLIYTAAWFWNPHVGSTAFGSYPLVVAAYGTCNPTLPTGWSRWTFFQYSDGNESYTPGVGPVPGIGQSCDRDRFRGTMAELQTFAGMAATPQYGATFVAQSFPYASAGAVTLHPGEEVAAWIELRNSGTATWDSRVRLGTTQPRDRSSSVAGSDWIAPNRLDAVTGTVPPGGTYRFNFHFRGAATPGRADEFFGVVAEGVTWFSAADQLGPPDNQLEGIVQTVAWPADAGPAPDAARPDASADAAREGGSGGDASSDSEAGSGGDGSTSAEASVGDGASSRSDARSEGGTDGGSAAPAMGGCGCRVPAGAPSGGGRGALWLGLGLGALAARRRGRGLR